jgi:uncharacterized protein YcbK (DUF882 family)
MEKITKNFSREEFKCKCGCGLMAINPAIVQRLQVIRDIVGLPITITSGYRCKKHNLEINGAKESQHMMGNAVDWTIKDYSMSSVALLLHEWSGGFHFYKDDNFIHTDIGPRRRW